MTAPDPMTPPECDLRGYDYMPWFGARLFGSTFYTMALANPRAGWAGQKLWWEAWTQCPAGSLPADDATLCRMADFGADLKAWGKCKDIALHGFVLCSDGRLYHPLICERAVLAYRKRVKERNRKAAYRKGRDAPEDGDGQGSPNDVPPPVPWDNQGTSLVMSQSLSASRPPVEERRGEESKEEERKEGRSLRSLPQNRPKMAGDFEAWWKLYPRKVGKNAARKMYDRAIKSGVSAEILMSSLVAQRWHPDPDRRPYPGTWLNEGRWEDDPDAAAPSKVNGWDQAGSEFFDFSQKTIEHEGNA